MLHLSRCLSCLCFEKIPHPGHHLQVRVTRKARETLEKFRSAKYSAYGGLFKMGVKVLMVEVMEKTPCLFLFPSKTLIVYYFIVCFPSSSS